MKINYDQESSTPPDIPETLKEEYRVWKLGPEAGFGEAKKSDTGDDRHLKLKNTMLVPIVAVAAAVTVAAAAVNVSPIDVISKFLTEPDSIIGDHIHDYEWRYYTHADLWDENGEYLPEYEEEGIDYLLSVHWQKCRICGQETEKTLHRWGCVGDERGHEYKCLDCGVRSGEIYNEPDDGSEIMLHTGNATCTHAAACADCGYVYKSTLVHEGPEKLVNYRDATDSSDGYSGDVICEGCGKTIRKGHGIPAGTHEHVFTYEMIDGDGTKHLEKCVFCGEEREEKHSFRACENDELLALMESDPDHEWQYRMMLNRSSMWIITENGHHLKCSKCGYETEVEEHTGGEANCTTGKRCEVCEEVYTEPDPENHNYWTHTFRAKEPTDTEPGYTGDEYCGGCGKLLKKGEEIPPLGNLGDTSSDVPPDSPSSPDTPGECAHPGLVHMSQTDPVHENGTLTKGHIDCYYCPDCHKYFKDASATETISADDIYIPVEHEMVPSFDENEHFSICTICGYIDESTRERHSLETQYDNAQHWEECSCGYQTGFAEHRPVDRSDANYHWSECSVCSYIDGDMTPHSGGEATCIHRAVCEVCDEEYGELDPDNHEGPEEIRGRIEPTETEKGYTGDTYCAACGALLYNGVEIETTMHEHGDIVFHPGVEATHYEPGSIAYYECGRCGKFFKDEECEEPVSAEQLVIPVVEHTLTTAYDASGHWEQCSCGYKTEASAHDLKKTYDESGHRDECACGYKTATERHTLSYDSSDSVHWQYCSGCAYATAKTAHTLEKKYDASGHWNECVCGYKSAASAHTLSYQSDSSGHSQKCSACAYVTAKAAHSYTQKYNSTNHWNECVCGYKSGTTKHTLSYQSQSSGHTQKCSGCAYASSLTAHTYEQKYDGTNHWNECVCGYKSGTTKHTLSYVNTEGSGHWQKCSACDYATAKTAHSGYTKKYNATYHWSECGVCGYKNSTTRHTLSYQSDSTQHWQACGKCDYATEHAAHQYTGSALATGICTTCQRELVYAQDDTNNRKLTPNDSSAVLEMTAGDRAYIKAIFDDGVSYTNLSWQEGPVSTTTAPLYVIWKDGPDCTLSARMRTTSPVTFILRFTCNGNQFEIPYYVTVNPLPASVEAKDTAPYVYVGESIPFGATLINPYSGSDVLTYNNPSPSIATVSSDGTLTGVKAGTVTITARSSESGVAKSVKVTVVDTPFRTSAVLPDTSGEAGALESSYIKISASDGTSTVIYGMDDNGNWISSDEMKNGFSYDPSTHVLTLTNVTGGYLDIYKMGTFLKIRVKGTCRLDNISVNTGNNYETAGLLFIGSGTLNVNSSQASMNGIWMYDSFNGYSNMFILVKGSVKLNVYAGESAGAMPMAIYMYTHESAAVVYDGSVTDGDGNTPVFRSDNAETYSFYPSDGRTPCSLVKFTP